MIVGCIDIPCLLQGKWIEKYRTRICPRASNVDLSQGSLDGIWKSKKRNYLYCFRVSKDAKKTFK